MQLKRWKQNIKNNERIIMLAAQPNLILLFTESGDYDSYEKRLEFVLMSTTNIKDSETLYNEFITEATTTWLAAHPSRKRKTFERSNMIEKFAEWLCQHSFEKLDVDEWCT